MRVRVRHYEMDALGHVNNAIYLNYVEEAAVEHARRLGYDEARWRTLGGTWVVRRHEIEYRLRHRYLDMIYTEDTLRRAHQRVKIIRTIRRHLDGLDYLEVETPTLHAIAGGAAARPFETHHNALDLPLLKTLLEAIMQCHGDPAVRALLLSGEGANFCAGGDVRDFAAKGDK